MQRHIILVIVLLAGLAATTAADESSTIARVFNLRYVSVSDAADAIQPLLSEGGSLTVQPHKSRVTVQDSPQVVARVADVIAELDKSPKKYSILVELLEGTDEQIAADRRAKVDSRVKRMFPFPSYRRIGSTVFEGELGSVASANLGDSYRISFLPNPLRLSSSSAYGIPDIGDRVQLEKFTLEQLSEKEDGEQGVVEVIRTDVHLSANQEVIIGAGASEDSRSGLVLIIQAEMVEEQ
jgi:hypothetical protein